MSYLPLLWTGFRRSPTRAWLTLASIAVAFLLFGLLQGMNAAFGTSVAASRLDRLYVQSKVNFTEPLPLAHLARIESVPGIDSVAFGCWFGGYFQDPKNFVFSFPVDAERYFSLYPEIKIAPEQLRALKTTRSGAVVGNELAKKFGWKIGDRVPLKSELWTHPEGDSDWSFEIVGIFEWPGDYAKSSSFYFNYAYFDESRAFGGGSVGWYVAHLKNVADAPKVAAAIDALFANSPDETKTQNEKENTQAFLRQFGDVDIMVTAIIGAVFFALLFLTGNNMMLSIRERAPEFAVLKTIGFTNARILALIFCETMAMCLIPAAIGLASAALIFPGLQPFLGVAALPPGVLGLGLGLATLLAFVVGVWPMMLVQRLSIVDSLAGR